MAKALLLLAIVYAGMILPISIVAVHIELLLMGVSGSFDWPVVLWPFELTRGRGISWGLAIGAGLAAIVAHVFYRAFIARRWNWVTEEQFQAIMGQKTS